MNERTNDFVTSLHCVTSFERWKGREGKGGRACLLARLLVCRLCFGWCWLVLVGGGCVASLPSAC